MYDKEILNLFLYNIQLKIKRLNLSIREIIRKISFFNHLNNDQIELIISISEVIKHHKKSILYHESFTSKHLLFLVKGLVEIYKIDKFNRKAFLYHIHENSMITELSSIKNNRIINCFSNAKFLEDSIVLYIDSEKFQELFLSKNILTEELIEVILKKNYQLHHIVNRELVFDATAKVAFMLIDDLKMFNKLKRVDISFMLNIQPETLSRVLKSLMRKGIINIKKGEIVIENKEDLISIFNKVGDTKYN